MEYRYSATHVVRELEVTERGAGFNEISVAVGGSLLPPIDESRGTAGSATTTEALHTTHSDYVHRRTFRAIPAKNGKFSSSLSLKRLPVSDHQILVSDNAVQEEARQTPLARSLYLCPSGGGTGSRKIIFPPALTDFSICRRISL